MTLWAGCYSRNPRVSLPLELLESIRRVVSRVPDETIQQSGNERCAVFTADVAYPRGSSIRTDGAGSFTSIAGDPLPDPDEQHGDRDTAIDALHSAWAREDWSATAAYHGTFCGVHYSAATHTLALVADKMGVRPVYYASTDDFVFFAGAQRVLESLAALPKRIDVRGVIELATLGYPLGARSPYSNIAVLRGGEVVGASDGRVWQRRYWRWDDVPLAAPRDEAVVAREVYDRFARAVADRRRGERVAAAFLSGGLDSRAIVAELRRAGVKTYTFNFASQHTQDQEFATAFAKASGAEHSQLPLPPGAPRWSFLMSRAWEERRRRGVDAIAHPQIVWSGDGGSVGLGHVYMTPSMVALLRRGDRVGAVREFTAAHSFHVARRLWQPEARSCAGHAGAGDAVEAGILEELEDIQCEDRGRDLHVFLLQNDQRRHLTTHFEDLDLHRLEFHLPFFDGRLLESIIASPLDLGLRHRLYNLMLPHFIPAVLEVPWQAYDGHEPCPIPVAAPLVRQWSRAQLRANVRAERRSLVAQVSEILDAPDFPDALLDKRFVRNAALIHRLGIRDLAYALKAAATVYRPWRVASGAGSSNRSDGV